MGFTIAGTLWGGRLASLDPFALIYQASWVVQGVLLVLIAFSVLSWAAIVSKWLELRAAEREDEGFLEVYHEGSPDAAYEAARERDRAPVAAIFLAAYTGRQRALKYSGRPAGAGLDPGAAERIAREIDWTAAREALRLESRLTFLATTGSATPFIGLFGTVVGIIDAFTGIGQAGSASLAVVAPGIAEALIATAVGLLTAIPATIFYNAFSGRLRETHRTIELFAHELAEDARRAGRAAGAGRAAER